MRTHAYASLFTLLNQANHLKRLPRAGWLFAGIVNGESVADHSYMTALTVFFLGEVVNQSWVAESLEEPLNLGKAVTIALIHDLAECVVTDLPKRATDLIGKSVKHGAEEEALSQLVLGLPNGDEALRLWQEYAKSASPEARLVKDADRLEMVLQAYRYEAQGHPNLSEFWHDHDWFYRSSQELFHQLCRNRKLMQNGD